MVEYRRGIARRREDPRWHWHPDCDQYPIATFAIRHDKPMDGELCIACSTLSREPKSRPVS